MESRRPASLQQEAKERRVKQLPTSRMLVCVPSLLRPSLADCGTEDMINSDDDILTPTKKRKYQATVDDSSDVGEGAVTGSGLTDQA